MLDIIFVLPSTVRAILAMQGLSAVFFFAYLCSAAAFTRIQPARAHRTRMFQAAEEQTVKDLDLDQMFEVFEQADKLPGGDKKMGGGGSPRSSEYKRTK